MTEDKTFNRHEIAKNYLEGVKGPVCLSAHFSPSTLSEKLRIAILAPTLYKHQYDWQISEHIQDFIKSGYEVTVFVLDSNKQFECAKINILGMPKNLTLQRIYRLAFPLDVFATLKWLSKLKGFHLIISHYYPMNWLAFLAKKIYKVKYVYFYHGIPEPGLYPLWYERIYIKLFNWLTKITVQNADYAFSISKVAQNELKRYTGLDSAVIYNKVDYQRFHPDIDGARIREKYQLGDAPVILNVGRVAPLKKTHLLIEVFNIIKQRIPNAKLIVVGEHVHSYYSKRLKRISDDSVIFVEAVPNKGLPYYYAACDIYATCSFHETFDMPLVEAQACGKPVVAFNVGAHPEVVDEHGTLVERGKLREFAETCIKKMLRKR